ncbi:hypothetical protein ACH5RR_000754 [Cinchona calisaya]|uniref:Transposase MuDR plant domain-containing protein n=1 Tax=Cinchona calisaya TaxID=153742 RepID=A0ABD3B240_9GENT
MKLLVLIHMTNGFGHGKQNESAEFYVTQANNIAFLDSEVGELGEIAKGDNEDSERDPGSSDGEEFHNSDYDFSKDDDDVIYNQSVATAGRDLSILLGIKEIGHEEQRIEEPKQHEPHEPEQKHKHDKAIAAYEEVRPTSRFVLCRSEIDMEGPNFYVELQFSSKNEFKKAVENHPLKWGKEFKWKKNDSIRMRDACKGNNCSWFVFASKMTDSDTFVIKTMDPPHQCGRTFYHKRVTSNFLSKRYVEFLRLNRKVTIREFQEKVHWELNANITRHQVYKTFQKAKILIYGKYKKQYSKLWDYYEELLVKDPGSTVDIIIAMDEIFGKERFQRMSVGIDPNDCIYPIAYAMVDIENNNSRRWFIKHFEYDLGIYDQQSWKFISDRQKGLGSAIHEILPRIEHRHCVRHLHTNFKKLYPGDSLKERVWACARSCPGEQVEESSMHAEMPYKQAGECNMQVEMQRMQVGGSNMQAERLQQQLSTLSSKPHPFTSSNYSSLSSFLQASASFLQSLISSQLSCVPFFSRNYHPFLLSGHLYIPTPRPQLFFSPGPQPPDLFSTTPSPTTHSIPAVPATITAISYDQPFSFLTPNLASKPTMIYS